MPRTPRPGSEHERPGTPRSRLGRVRDLVHRTVRPATNTNFAPGSSNEAIHASSDEAETVAPEAAAATEPVAVRITTAREDDSTGSKLWTQAYEAVRTGEPQLVATYETIIRQELVGQLGDGDEPATFHIAPDLVEEVLAKSRRREKAGKTLDSTLKVVSGTKELVSSAIKSAPEASAVWGGVCVLLTMIETSKKEADDCRKGIQYVLERLEWYLSFCPDFFESASARSPEQKKQMQLDEDMQRKVVHLYQSLLKFQMKAICWIKRTNSVLKTAGNAVKYNDWDSALKEVQELEERFRKDRHEVTFHQISTDLSDLRNVAIKQEDQQYLVDMDKVNPKTRLKQLRLDLMEECSDWILDEKKYNQLLSGDPECRMLCIVGDAGKGKTMLLTRIIQHLTTEANQGETPVGFFYCKFDSEDSHNAADVLRGIVCMLCSTYPGLIPKVRKACGVRDKSIFANKDQAFDCFSERLEAIMGFEEMSNLILVIDALDECVSGQDKLLDFLTRCLRSSTRTRIVVSSRPPFTIAQNDQAGRALVSLELNSGVIAKAVHHFIDRKVDRISSAIRYEGDSIAIIKQHLLRNAEDTFLWVALACDYIRSRPLVKSPGRVRLLLQDVPAGLNTLYGRMAGIVVSSADAVPLLNILTVVVTVAMPITAAEIWTLQNQDCPLSMEEVREHIVNCGSFLRVKDDEKVHFVHLSAREYLLRSGSALTLEPDHLSIALNSLAGLTRRLERDMYKVDDDTIPVVEFVKKATTRNDLDSLRYSCVRWASHVFELLRSSQLETFRNHGGIEMMLVLFEEKILNWLEALSISRSIPAGIKAINSLASIKSLLKNQRLIDLIEDARRFVHVHHGIIASNPLQVYTSALLLSPSNSLIRKARQHDMPDWIDVRLDSGPSWGRLLHSLSIGRGYVGKRYPISFSADGELLAFVMGEPCSDRDQGNECIESWLVVLFDTSGGEFLGNIKVHTKVLSMAFRPHSSNRLIAIGCTDSIKVLDLAEFEMKISFRKDETDSAYHLFYSEDGQELVSISAKGHVKVWCADGGWCKKDFGKPFQDNWIFANERVAYIPKQRKLVISDGSTLQVLDLSGLAESPNVQGDSISEGHVLAISPNGRLVLTHIDGPHVKVIDRETKRVVASIKIYEPRERDWIFSADSSLVSTVTTVWNVDSQNTRTEIFAPGQWAKSLSPCGQKLVTATEGNRGFNIWEVSLKRSTYISEPALLHAVIEFAISPDGKWLALARANGIAELWDLGTGSCEKITSDGDLVSFVDTCIAISSHGDFASGYGNQISFWSRPPGLEPKRFRGEHDVRSVCLSQDGTTLVCVCPLSSGSGFQLVLLRVADETAVIIDMPGYPDAASLTISPDGRRLAMSIGNVSVLYFSSIVGNDPGAIEASMSQFDFPETDSTTRYDRLDVAVSNGGLVASHAWRRDVNGRDRITVFEGQSWTPLFDVECQPNWMEFMIEPSLAFVEQSSGLQLITPCGIANIAQDEVDEADEDDEDDEVDELCEPEKYRNEAVSLRGHQLSFTIDGKSHELLVPGGYILWRSLGPFVAFFDYHSEGRLVVMRVKS